MNNQYNIYIIIQDIQETSPHHENLLPLSPPHEPRSSVSVRDAPGHQAKKVPGPRLPSKNAPGTEEPQFEHTVDGSEIRLSSWYSKYPIIYRVLAPSQVVVGDFFHQQ